MDTAALPKDMLQPMTGAGETGSPADRNLLRHLLDLETQAAVLVDDAQAEADRRVAEGEKRSRARYDEAYAAEVAALEAVYTTETGAIRADYKQQLDAYREGLMAMPVDREAFSVLVGRFFIGEK
jgi:hypothetical protein